jgi:integrase
VGRRLVDKDTKTHQERRVTVDAGLVAMLAAHGQRAATRARQCEVGYGAASYVFSPDPAGAVPLNPDHLSAAWRRSCARAGIVGLRLHDLRHWHATTLLADGIGLEAVSGRLGHGVTSTTLDFYTHAIPQHDADAAAAIGRALGR